MFYNTVQKQWQDINICWPPCLSFQISSEAEVISSYRMLLSEPLFVQILCRWAPHLMQSLPLNNNTNLHDPAYEYGYGILHWLL